MHIWRTLGNKPQVPYADCQILSPMVDVSTCHIPAPVSSYRALTPARLDSNGGHLWHNHCGQDLHCNNVVYAIDTIRRR